MIGMIVALVLGSCGGGDRAGEPPGAPSGASTVVTTAAVPPEEPPTTAEATTTSATGGDRTLECGQVAFTPASEDAASNITAQGVTCTVARELVEDAGRRTSATGPDRVDVGGYSCRRTASESDPLPVSSYRCERDGGDAVITFERS